MSRKVFLLLLTAVAASTALISAATGATAGDAEHSRDAVYTMSNSTAGNSVLQFNQSADGSLTAGASYPSGGLGTGAGLGNQGALIADGRHLFAVNAGSDDLSVFRVTRRGLRLVDRVPSGGIRPVSVTVHANLVYVLNAGSDNIAGFRLRRNGRLEGLFGSEQGLSGSGTAPAQIEFSKDGGILIVTEKATNNLVTFAIDEEGLPHDRTVIPSPGQTPFGFALGKDRQLFVSEAAGGAPNASSVTAWRIVRNGDLRVIDPSSATLQSAACWVVVTPDGRFAYVTNTGSGTISGFRIGGRGQLRLLNADGITATAGRAPIDLALSDDGRLLHVLNSTSHSIGTFRVLSDGQLEHVGDVEGLPPGSNGLAAF